MRRYVTALAAIAFIALVAIAYAGSGTINILQGNSAPATYATTTDATGNNLGNVVICDQIAGGNCATVNQHQLLVAATQSGTWNLSAVLSSVTISNVSVINTVSTSPTGSTPITGNIGITGTVTTSPSGNTPVTGTINVGNNPLTPLGTTATSGIFSNIIGTVTVSTANSTAPVSVIGTATVSTADNTVKVNCLSGCTGSAGTNITQWASTNLGSATTYGTPPTGSTVIGVNSFITSGVISATGNVAVTNVNANGQATMANSSPVAVASDQTSIPTSTTIKSISAADPCYGAAKSLKPIAQSTSNVTLVAGATSSKVYICSLALIVSQPTDIAVIESASGNCGTPISIIGNSSPQSATMQLVASAGLTYGNGQGTVAATGTSGNGVCLSMTTSGATSPTVAGTMTYIQQ